MGVNELGSTWCLQLRSFEHPAVVTTHIGVWGRVRAQVVGMEDINIQSKLGLI